MISPPMGTVTLPVYDGFTKFLVWPKPHAVSIEKRQFNNKEIFIIGQKLLWSDVQGDHPSSNSVQL